jgi:hypothetical protein
MALVYEAFLGSHGINEIGAQLQWIAPTPIYLMLGAEVLQGSNEQMFGREAIMIDEDIIAPSASAPSLVVAYAKSSFELTDTTTALLGASLAIGDARLDHLEDEEPHAFYGDSSLYGIDATLKHYFNSYSYLNWQSEWLYRELDGKQYNQAADIHVNMTKKQAGYYTQLIYAHNQNWRAGIRYDSIYKNDVTANATAKNLEDGFDKYSLMLDYTFSEFSRLRLQYNRNNAMFNEEGERQHIDTYIVQLNISIGAHGAHAF